MNHWEQATPGTEGTPGESFRRVTRETLERLPERHSAASLEAAAGAVADAVETLGEEILLVDPDWLIRQEHHDD
jgi:hypothetical protein